LALPGSASRRRTSEIDNGLGADLLTCGEANCELKSLLNLPVSARNLRNDLAAATLRATVDRVYLRSLRLRIYPARVSVLSSAPTEAVSPLALLCDAAYAQSCRRSLLYDAKVFAEYLFSFIR